MLPTHTVSPHSGHTPLTLPVTPPATPVPSPPARTSPDTAPPRCPLAPGRVTRRCRGTGALSLRPKAVLRQGLVTAPAVLCGRRVTHHVTSIRLSPERPGGFPQSRRRR